MPQEYKRGVNPSSPTTYYLLCTRPHDSNVQSFNSFDDSPEFETEHCGASGRAHHVYLFFSTLVKIIYAFFPFIALNTSNNNSSSSIRYCRAASVGVVVTFLYLLIHSFLCALNVCALFSFTQSSNHPYLRLRVL